MNALGFSYVRMSTDMQLKGHSQQRQLDASADYAKAHGLHLVERFEDIGVSAFKGANVREGALGRFLAAVKTGSIPAGSTCIVESLDRISRQDIRKSLKLFLDIIDSGITVVTLQDNREYRPDSSQFEDLLMSLMVMSRAHEESLTKSKRVSAAWANKRLHATSKKVTSLCPGWLKAIHDNKLRFEKIPERVSVVKSIFDDTVAGIGAYVITKRLNRKKIPPFGRSKGGWYRASVAHIITSREVLGEFQSCKMVDGKRQPTDDPIKNYFPRIISDKLFYRAQQARQERRVSGRGRKGKYVTNLFAGLATCTYCHARMSFEDKGPPRGTYLVCEAAKRSAGCGVRTGWRYSDFETSFLTFVARLDLPTLIRDDDSKVKALDEEIQALEAQLIGKQAEMEKLYAVLQSTSTPIEFLRQKFAELQKHQNETKASLDAKVAERQQLRLVENAFYQSKVDIKSLIEKLQASSRPGQDLYKVRSQVAARISRKPADRFGRHRTDHETINRVP